MKPKTTTVAYLLMVGIVSAIGAWPEDPAEPVTASPARDAATERHGVARNDAKPEE